MEDSRHDSWPAAPVETWTVRYYGTLRGLAGNNDARAFQVQAGDRREAIRLADREATSAFLSYKFISAECGSQGGAA